MNYSSPHSDAIYSSLASDPDFGELVEMFVSEMPNKIETLRTSFAMKDRETTARMAHQLKGAAGSYGFPQVTDIAACLERSVRDNQPEQDIEESLSKLIGMCEKMRAGTPESLPVGNT